MTEGSAAIVTIDIKHMLDCLPPTLSNPTIFRVGDHLRSGGCEKMYEPKILSVGPYHHGILRLQNMEQHKYKYVKRLLSRNEQTVDRYVTAAAAMEKEARKCYAEPLDIDENEFVRLMVLDGLFLIELFRCYACENLRDKDDPIFRDESIWILLRHDIILVENQLPFFVLNELFKMTKTDQNPDEDLTPLLLPFVRDMFPDLSVSQMPVKNFDHLCGLLHHAWCLPFAVTLSPGCTHDETDNWVNIKSVSGLHEAGIQFRKATGSNNLMDIKFETGVLKIPRLSIFDETESLFRNLVVCEQHLPEVEPGYVSSYVFFMHCLLNSSDDVKLLRSCEIIENCVGNDNDVSLMFHRVGRNIPAPSSFCYSSVFYKLNKHCHCPANQWKAILRQNYFNAPWSILKFLAAVAMINFALF